jgi:glycosyl hydrolase family 42 (putative beta-galactosidase)
MRLLVAVTAALAALAVSSPALGSPAVRYGVQDDAWLRFGPGTLQQRLDRLQSLGVDLMRVNVYWSEVQPRKGVFDWSGYDPVIKGLHQAGIEPVLTLVSTPRWANGGRGTNWAPTSGSSFAAFAAATARRYPFVRRYLIWNEPNQRRWLRPTLPSVYVRTLLNPAYNAIHKVRKTALVGGGVTAPRAVTGGVSPEVWIRSMGAYHAKLDAYAHNPYPLSPRETPLSGGCDHCTTLTMATLPRLIADVGKAFGTKARIWLTEYGYQTNPPDKLLGVSKAKQALYMSEGAMRAYLSPRVDMLIQYLVKDEPDISRWQSGILTVTGAEKPSYLSFQLPFSVEKRTPKDVTLWGQIRPGGGRQQYVIEELRGTKWLRVGGVRRTSPHGFFTRVVPTVPGASYRVLQLTRGLTSVPAG